MDVAILAGVAGAGLVAGLLLLRGRSRPASSRRVAAPGTTAGKAAGRADGSGTGKTTRRPATGASGVAAPPPAVGMKVSNPQKLDLARLQTVPPDLPPPQPFDRDFPQLEEIEAAVRSAADRLQGRRGLLEALSSETRDPLELTALIQTDPALADGIVARVNGPQYGLEAPIEQVSRATLFLGHVEVRNLAWRACLSEVIHPSSSMTAGAFERHWQHAFMIARAAHALATALGLPRPDMIATAGLLHDMGKLLALGRWPDRARAFDGVAFSDHAALSRELERLGVGHAYLGAQLCRAAQLPREVSQIVAQHHVPSYAPPVAVEGNQKAVAIVHLADLFAHLAQAHLSGRPPAPVYRMREGWLELLKVRALEDLLVQNVVLALLDPSVAWRGVPEGSRAA